MTLILASVSPTSLSTGYNFNDAVQKFRHLRRNPSESVWGILASIVATVFKNEKKTDHYHLSTCSRTRKPTQKWPTITTENSHSDIIHPFHPCVRPSIQYVHPPASNGCLANCGTNGLFVRTF